MGRFYGSMGCTDVTPEPDATVGEENGVIEVLVKVDDGGQ